MFETVLPETVFGPFPTEAEQPQGGGPGDHATEGPNPPPPPRELPPEVQEYSWYLTIASTPRRLAQLLAGPTIRRLFVTCDVFTRYFFVAFPWLFRGFFVALICLEKQCLGVFRGFFVVFSWLFRGFFVALILGKFYAYSP